MNSQMRATPEWSEEDPSPVILRGLVRLTPELRWAEANPRLISRLSTSDQILGQFDADLMHPDDRSEADVTIRKLRSKEIDKHTLERRYRTSNGSWCWFSLTIERVDVQGELVGFQCTLEDISSRKKAEEHLRDVATELAVEHEIKDEFLAMLSHELRKPLSPMLNAVELMRRRLGDPDESERRLEQIKRQIERLARIVDDLLNLSRMRQEKLHFLAEPVDVAEVLNDSLELSRPALDADGIEAIIHGTEKEVIIQADRVRLAQVFDNLIDNARKYTDTSGRLEIALEDREGDDELRVRFRDTGIGIEPDTLPYLFDVYNQARRSLKRSQGGLGIGLALCKSIVERHGGNLHASSQGKGQGSEFVVSLPKAWTESSIQSPVEGRSKPRTKVLIIEDGADAGEMLSDLLSLEGFETRLVTTGGQGIELVREWRPSVVVCDLGLPDVDGQEVAAEIRLDPEVSGITMIAVTGFQSLDLRGGVPGFDRLMTKPLDTDLLTRWIRASNE